MDRDYRSCIPRHNTADTRLRPFCHAEGLVFRNLLVGTALAQGSIDWWVIGGGGGSDSADSTSLDGTIGQWVVGSDTSGTTQLEHGFWGGGVGEYEIFLPAVLREE